MSELSRLRWLCRRGMKELDLVMTEYLEAYYETASSAEQAHFRELLTFSDPDLYRLLLGQDLPKSPELTHFAQNLRTLLKHH